MNRQINKGNKLMVSGKIHVYQLEWEDGTQCGYYSSIPKLVEFLEDFLTEDQRSMARSFVIHKHGVNHAFYSEYEVFPTKTSYIVKEKNNK